MAHEVDTPRVAERRTPVERAVPSERAGLASPSPVGHRHSHREPPGHDAHTGDSLRAPRQAPTPPAFKPRTPSTPAPCRARTPIFSFASGKGGVGKTSVAVNLAAILASRFGLRVVLLDADLGMANADVLCGLTPNNRLDAALASTFSSTSPPAATPGTISTAFPPAALHAAPARTIEDLTSRLESLAIEAPAGFRLIPGSVSGGVAAQQLSANRFRTLLEAARGMSCDLVIMDLGAGIHVPVLESMRSSDVSVVIATPEPTSMTDAYALMKCLSMSESSESHASVPSRVQLLINRVHHEDEARDVHQRIARVAQHFLGLRPGFLGWLREDARVHDAVMARTPLAVLEPGSRFVRDLEVFAGGLLDSAGIAARRATLPAAREQPRAVAPVSPAHVSPAHVSAVSGAGASVPPAPAAPSEPRSLWQRLGKALRFGS
ncbi:MAG: AAA family ATPase [Planctomycetota bacterium]|nr:AAA family ATPase [Planctomycetota bacterium]